MKSNHFNKTTNPFINFYLGCTKSIIYKKIIIPQFFLFTFLILPTESYSQLKDKFQSADVTKDSLVRVKTNIAPILEIDNELIYENFDDIYTRNISSVCIKPGVHKLLLNNNLSFKNSELECFFEFGHEYLFDGANSHVDTINKLINYGPVIYRIVDKKTQETVCIEKNNSTYIPFQETTGEKHLYYGETIAKDQLAFLKIGNGLKLVKLNGISNDGFSVLSSTSDTNIFLKPGYYKIDLTHYEPEKISASNASFYLNLDPGLNYNIEYLSNSCYWSAFIKQNDSIISTCEPIFLRSNVASNAAYGAANAIGSYIADNMTNEINDYKNIKKILDIKLSKSDTINNIDFSTISFNKDGNLGWIIAKNGKVIKTTNSGKLWTITKGNRIGLKNIYFSDSLSGIATGDTISGMFRTRNGGKTWSPVFVNLISVNDIVFIDNILRFYSNSKAIFRMDIGSGSWKKLSKSLDAFINIFFLNDQVGWAIEANGRIVHTTDGGKNWTTQKSYYTKGQKQVFFTNELNGWIIGKDGLILTTKDGGENWMLQKKITFCSLNDIYFLNENEGWIVGDVGTLLHTKNGGESWEIIKLSDIVNL